MPLTKNKKYYIDRFNELKGEYSANGVEAVDRDKTKYLYPHGRNLVDAKQKSDGTRKDEYILNNTVLLAIRVAVSGIFSGSVNPLEKWFRLADEDKELNDSAAVSEFYQKVTDLILLDMGKSNFYSIMELAIKDILTYSISDIHIDEDFERVFNFTHVPNGQYYIDVDSRGEVSAVYREFRLRGRNVIAEYGEENVSQKVMDTIAGDKTGGTHINLLHVVERNEGRDITKEDNQNMPWTSITYEIDNNHKNEKPLRKSGYRTKPNAIPRWSVSSGNIYGNGPGDMALGDAKQLQKLASKLMETIEKDINPPLIGPDGDLPNTGPNEMNFKDHTSSGRPGIEPLYRVSTDISKLVALIIATQERIKAAFFSNLFFAQGETDPRETGPAIQRMTPEMFQPIIQRCFDIEFRLGRLPDIPNELQGREIKIEIISSLTKAQELSIITPIQEITTLISQAAQFWPEALDKLDIDKAIDEIEGALGIQAGVIRRDEVVQEIRTARAEARLREQQAQQAQEPIEGAETLSKTDMSADNALNAVIQQAGGQA
jgi:hypothetical protein